LTVPGAATHHREWEASVPRHSKRGALENEDHDARVAELGGTVTGSGVRPVLRVAVCIVDDDMRTYDLRITGDGPSVLKVVAVAVERGRRLRAHVLATNPRVRSGEEEDLRAKGYVRAFIKLP
jgi:hypothetical protein